MIAVNPFPRHPEIWSNTSSTAISQWFPGKIDLFLTTMSHGTEDKQVVSLLEYGLNDVSSFICLLIGHIFPLSPFLEKLYMQFATFPLRLRLVKCSTETYYCFFLPHFLRSLNFSSPPAVLLSIMYQVHFGWQQIETFPLNPAAAAAARTSACSSTVIFIVLFVLDHQFDWGSQFHCTEGGERSCMHLMLWSLIFEFPDVKMKNSHILSMENVSCYVCHQEKWPRAI